VAAGGLTCLRQICTKRAFLLMIVEEKPTMTRAVEAGIGRYACCMDVHGRRN
jgi:hypothetical protein